MSFSIGDKVRLNSGGPALTVVDFGGGAVTVAWRDDAGTVHEAEFSESCVTRIGFEDYWT